MWFSSFILKNLFRRKVRSLLTATGIGLAIGAMVALLGITDGFKKSTLASFENHGTDLVVTGDGVVDQLASDLDEKVADQIAALPGVQIVGSGLLDLVDYQKRNSTMSFFVQGWEPGSFQFDGVKILQGRALQKGDKRVTMLGRNLATNLKMKVGDSIEIRGETFEVVGVGEGASVYEDGMAIIAIKELQQMTRKPGRVTGFSIVLDKSSGRSIDDVKQAITSLRDPNDGKPLRLAALTTNEYVNTMMHIRVASAMAWMVSLVAVLIGAIGMLNTMIMSVLERVKEIGVLRAVGWRKSRVVRMILSEAVLLSLAGAVVGISGAWLLTRVLTQLPTVNGFIVGEIALWVMAEGLLFAVAVGVLGGLYPAWRAARLLPTEAVRHE